ncbi:hypothetical protein D5400_03220 [Georhizobium profundi]|uniref:DUF4407 domain-containing protein n=1 Tax=Georhizobium profundi TaxID=2341112 RepID=A0A3S9B9F3_9HYPH|nr:hypothetical protein [Georhizobium profundi]AZN73547.1 hypothetical protein D5400_03220 [Georhizobium profundi]
MSGALVTQLRDSLGKLETMTRFALATLALASGVYTYLGVRGLLDGTATIVFFAAIIYSAAVSVGIYAFWTYLMRLFPHVASASARAALLGVMALGSVMIIAMSSWLNAAALAGSAALEQHLAVTLQDYTSDLDRAHENALAAQSLLPDIQLASERFARLAAQERESGALTGTSGSGSVVQLLSQMSSQLRELEGSIASSRDEAQTLFETGQEHLVAMRSLVSASGAIEPRADSFAENAVMLAGVISAMEQTSVAPSVKRAAEDLSLGFIAPIADGGDLGLVDRQDRVMGSIQESVAAQSLVLSQAADDILAREPVAERRFVPMSSAEAVLRYAGDFIPSWAGAISIDLLPSVLVLMLAVAHAVLRDAERRLPYAERVSAADLIAAMEVHRALSGIPSAPEPEVDQQENVPAPAAARDATERPEAQTGAPSRVSDKIMPIVQAANPRTRKEGS